MERGSCVRSVLCWPLDPLIRTYSVPPVVPPELDSPPVPPLLSVVPPVFAPPVPVLAPPLLSVVLPPVSVPPLVVPLLVFVPLLPVVPLLLLVLPVEFQP